MTLLVRYTPTLKLQRQVSATFTCGKQLIHMLRTVTNLNLSYSCLAKVADRNSHIMYGKTVDGARSKSDEDSREDHVGRAQNSEALSGSTHRYQSVIQS